MKPATKIILILALVVTFSISLGVKEKIDYKDEICNSFGYKESTDYIIDFSLEATFSREDSRYYRFVRIECDHSKIFSGYNKVSLTYDKWGDEQYDSEEVWE